MDNRIRFETISILLVGGVFALIAAHLSHLFLNWNDDTFVFRQSVDWDGRRTNDKKDHKPPQALPSIVARNIRYVRLLITLVLLIFELAESRYRLGANNVSHAAHFFGALAGFIMGIIFLRARYLRAYEKKLKNVLLLIACGLPFSIILIKHYQKLKIYRTIPLSNCPFIYWKDYEKACQEACYPNKVRISINETCASLFKIYDHCKKH